MTSTSRYRAVTVSAGMATGHLYLGGGIGAANDEPSGLRPATADEVREGFAAVAAERSALAEQLRSSGRGEQADIVTVGALIAADPSLVESAILALRDGSDAASAVRCSTEAQAAALASLDNPDMAARADDVRNIASAVLAHLAAGSGTTPLPPAGDYILVQREVDPAELIRLADAGLTGAVSVSGGASSHAAIIARGLGLPMLAGADAAVLSAAAGRPAILDGAAGELIVDPSPRQIAAAAAGRGGDVAAGRPGQGTVPEPAELRTVDGEPVTLLCNVASAVETRRGLTAGAAGVGLLRTEIPFLGASAWPSQDDHRASLAPVLDLLAGRPAVVRLLDFAGDKIPPFLVGRPAGLTALLGHPSALCDQLRAALTCGGDTLLRIMVPMVETAEEMAQVRSALAGVAAEVGADLPELGMMVEVASTAEAAGSFAGTADFFSIGTNDLTSQVLGIPRDDPRMHPALAADPRILALIGGVVHAAEAAGITVSVCGDAAADPVVLPLLIGLGVRTLSVGPARLSQVRELIGRADATRCKELAGQALQVVAVDRVRTHPTAP